MSELVGHKAVKGTVWVTIDKFSYMGLQFLVNLVLTRMLVPGDFGVVGLLSIFTAVSQTLIDGGFGNALIQKKTPTQTDYSTIFYWNLAVSVVLYAILFFSAPLIARFFDIGELVGVTRAVGITLILNALTTIQINRLRKHLEFKTLTIVNVVSYALAGGFSIWLASIGWGVYSIVALAVLLGLFSLIILAVVTRWHPSLCFSMQSFKSLFGYGGYMLGANLLQVICINFQNIVIGRKFSARQLGLYSQANKLDQITSNTIPQILVQVMFPVYSSVQDDREKLLRLLSMNMRVIAFMIFPVMALLIILGYDIITFLYGDKWVEAVPYFQILCAGGFFGCLLNINFYAVAAMGKSKALFHWSLQKWSVLIILILIGMNLGMQQLLWCMVISRFNIFMVNAYLSSKYVGFSFRMQFTELLPPALATMAAAAAALAVRYLVADSVLLVFVVFAAVYFGVSSVAKLQSMSDMKSVVQLLLKRKKPQV